MSKYRAKNGTPEVHSARSKLDGVLQTLVTKTDDSPQKPDEEESAEEALTATPTKRAPRPSRKRKRGRDEPTISQEMGQYHHTYVMKLFDRSVDLAQFGDDAPLYPICRAWMRNQPHNRNLGPRDRSPTPEPPDSPAAYDDEEELSSVYRLPSPLRLKVEVGTEGLDYRVPSPIAQPDDHLDIHADPDMAPAPEQILLNHMVRWKQTRQKWRDHARRGEAKFAESLDMLKKMFDQQCKE